MFSSILRFFRLPKQVQKGNTAAKPDSTTIINEMIRISKYLKRNIQVSDSFKPEFEASQLINNIIGQSDQLDTTVVLRLLEILNAVNKTEHYDGSGWLEYKIQLSNLLECNGFKVEWSAAELHLS